MYKPPLLTHEINITRVIKCNVLIVMDFNATNGGNHKIKFLVTKTGYTVNTVRQFKESLADLV